MKKNTISVFVVVLMIAVLTLGGCGQKGPEPSESNIGIVVPRTIEFETGEATISVPDNWEVIPDSGTDVPLTVQTYNLDVLPPMAEKTVGIVTIGETLGGEALSEEDFESLVTSRVEMLLDNAVEETANYAEMPIEGGYGVFCILTDSDLVGKTTKPDEYLYLAVFFANHDNGWITYASLLTDDCDSDSFKMLLLAVAGIKASFDS